MAPARRASEARIVRAVGAAERRSPVGSTCLATALAAQALLARHGYAASLRIGVKRSASGEFAAHAWLVREGRVIVGGPAEAIGDYTPLPEMELLKP
jgi:hypothetical protein